MGSWALCSCWCYGKTRKQNQRLFKYDRIIDGCFLHPYKPEIVPIQEHNAPDPGHCIGNECGGICPPCKSEPIPKEDPESQSADRSCGMGPSCNDGTTCCNGMCQTNC